MPSAQTCSKSSRLNRTPPADLNYSDKNSRVSREHDDESLRDVALVSAEVPDWDSYDTVFIGYPIWWGGAAWPMNGFMTANDFTGKTVIPFATAASSGMGDSGTDLAKLAGTGDWLDGQPVLLLHHLQTIFKAGLTRWACKGVFLMRKNFGTNPYFFPLPVLIVGSYDGDGNAKVMPLE